MDADSESVNQNGMTFAEWTKSLVSARGRITPSQYWFVNFFAWGVVFALTILIAALFQDRVLTLVVFGALLLAAIIVIVVQSMKRLADLGQPPSHFFYHFVPVYNFYFEYILYFREGVRGRNEYGDDPRDRPWPGRQLIQASVIVVLALAFGLVEYSANPRPTHRLVSSDGRYFLTAGISWDHANDIQNEIATLKIGRSDQSAYTMVVEEDSADVLDMSLEQYYQLLEERFEKHIDARRQGQPSLLTIGGNPALQVGFLKERDEDKIRWLVTAIRTHRTCYQVLAFTSPKIFPSMRDELRQIVDSFTELN